MEHVSPWYVNEESQQAFHTAAKMAAAVKVCVTTKCCVVCICDCLCAYVEQVVGSQEYYAFPEGEYFCKSILLCNTHTCTLAHTYAT